MLICGWRYGKERKNITDRISFSFLFFDKILNATVELIMQEETLGGGDKCLGNAVIADKAIGTP
jgi:hypothetical protein